VAVFFIDPSSLGCTCGRGSGDFLVRSSTLGNRVNVVNLKHDPMVIRRTRPAFCTAAVITFQYVPPGSGAFRGGESDRSAELTGCSAASGRFGVTLDNITFGEVIPKCANHLEIWGSPVITRGPRISAGFTFFTNLCECCSLPKRPAETSPTDQSEPCIHRLFISLISSSEQCCSLGSDWE
jgi:hypothetical protein